MVQEFKEGFFQLVKTVVVGFKVIPVNVGHQRDNGLQEQERTVTFISFGNQVLALAETCITAPGIEQATDHKSWIHAGLSQ